MAGGSIWWAVQAEGPEPRRNVPYLGGGGARCVVQLKRAVGPMGVAVGAAVMGVPAAAGAEPPLLALPEAGRCAVPCVKIAHPRHPLRTRYYLCLTVKNSSSEVYVSPPQVSLGLQVREPGFETEPRGSSRACSPLTPCGLGCSALSAGLSGNGAARGERRRGRFPLDILFKGPFVGVNEGGLDPETG